MENDDEFIYEDRYFGPNEQEFLPEVNIMERVGYEAGPHATQLELQNDPVKRFRVYTNSTAINLSSNKLLPNLTRFDVDEILRKTEVVRNPAYKNPLGFVLGYYIIKDGGGSFKSSNFNSLARLVHIMIGIFPVSP